MGTYDPDVRGSCVSETEKFPGQASGHFLLMLGVVWFAHQAPSLPSPLGQPCTPPSEPRGPGAQSIRECTTDWLSLRQLIWTKQAAGFGLPRLNARGGEWGVLAWGQPVPICALVISCGVLEIFVGAGKEAN